MSSTTRWVMPPATNCCAASARGSKPVSAPATPSRAWVETNSRFWSKTAPRSPRRSAKRLARAFDSALDIGDNRVYVHLSIGVATARPDDGASVTAADLLNHAEAARSRAEQTSATDVQTFTPEMDAHLGTRQSFRDGIARLQLLWDLRRAIDDRLLTLVYQPQFGMASGAVCGAEALLRWEHPTLGTLEPREFLPLVREHGLMDAVTDLVLSRAVADASGWHAGRHRDPGRHQFVGTVPRRRHPARPHHVRAGRARHVGRACSPSRSPRN